MTVQFEWDQRKARTNLAKHGVSFELAQRVWDDPRHLLVFDDYQDSEPRWRAIGLVEGVVIIVVVHTYRGDAEERVRMIGARKATRRERRAYDAEAS